MKIIIVVASANSKGNTMRLANHLQQMLNCDLVDLSKHKIDHYDYEHNNRDDDFIPLITELINYDVLVFATPVYWYAMSGLMKVFFDRLTDLITVEKPLGRKLQKVSMAAISSSNGDNLGQYFWLPFQKTAEYLGTRFISKLHTIENTDYQTELKKFSESILLIEK